MTRKLVAAALVGGALWTAGCADGGGPGGPGSPGGPALSTAEFNLVSDPDFSYNSVKIRGKRVDKYGHFAPADTKYPCVSEFEECFEFDEWGNIVEDDGYGNKVPVKFEDLCPSANFPEAKWQFDYTVYAKPYCAYGYEITAPGNPHNFACFDSKDVYKQDRPNQSLEYLMPGKNYNEIICITTNAQKTFDFDVCVDKSTYEDKAYETLRLDCGCEPDQYNPYQCVCDQGIEGLPYNCTIDPYDGCNVVCTKPKPVYYGGAEFHSFGNTYGKEIACGINDLYDPADRVEEDFTWQKDGVYDVKFSYDPSKPELKTEIYGGPTVVYPLSGVLGSMDSYEIVIGDTDGYGSVSLKDVYLDGEAVGTAYPGDGTSKSYKFWSGKLNDGFVMTGKLVLKGDFSYTEDKAKVKLLVGKGLAP